jgi:tetratricopeptide (TPR) repeat protein
VLRAIRETLPFIGVVTFFVLIRLCISSFPEKGNDITSDPYIFATMQQKLATVSFILFNYLEMIFYPAVLIFDYGYNHIPYTDFTNPKVLISVITYLTALFFAVFWILKRDIKGFFLISYLIGILFVSNLFLNIGPPMADRFLYVPSFFLLVFIVLIIKDITEKRFGKGYVYVFSVCSLFIFPFSFYKTRERIAEWKNNQTLYKADLKKAPNSYRILAFNGMIKVDSLSLVTDSIQRMRISNDALSLFRRAYNVNPNYKMMFKEWGFAYYTLKDIDSAQWAWDIHKHFNPKSPYNKVNENLLNSARFKQYIKIYNENYMKGDMPFLIKNVKQAIHYKPDDFESIVLLGKLYYIQNRKDSASYYWNKAFELDQTNKELTNYLKLIAK